MTRDVVILGCLLLIGIAGIIVVCTVTMPHLIGAIIGIASSVAVIVGALGLWAIFDHSSHDDDDGPHFYGPGGTII